MQNRSKSCLVCGGVLLGLVFIFCGTGSKDPVVVQVNNVPITKGEILQSLPQAIAPGQESLVVQECVDGLVNRELFVQEAIRLGLDSVIAYPLELEKKALVIYELFAAVGREAKPVTAQELERSYKLLGEEVHCRLIAVWDRTLAESLEQELRRGANFESLATQFSIHPSQEVGGDMGYVRLYNIDEPLRSAIMGLKPGEWTRPVFFDSSFQIVLLVDRRAVDPPLPPFGEIKQRLEEQIKISRQRQVANEYVQNLRQRLVYNPAGLEIFYKPVDSITPADKEVWVAVRDSAKYVKVGRLLHIARRFPPELDTAIRTYAIKRAIEDDLMYEDGLKRGLDRVPSVVRQLERVRRRLLYETLYNRMITSQIEVTEEEVRDYYQQHRDRYPGNNFEGVFPLIRNNIFSQRRDARFQEYLSELRARANIRSDQRRLEELVRERKNRQKQKNGGEK